MLSSYCRSYRSIRFRFRRKKKTFYYSPDVWLVWIKMLITEQHQCDPWFTRLFYDCLHRHRRVFMRNTLHIILLSCWKQIGKYDYTTHCICWILTSWKVCCLRENNELLVGSFNAACWLYKALWPVDPCLRVQGDDEVKQGGVLFKPTSIWRQAVDNRGGKYGSHSVNKPRFDAWLYETLKFIYYKWHKTPDKSRVCLLVQTQ